MRRIIVPAALTLVLIIAMAGCDQAEKALEKTDLGATTEITKLIGSATKALGGITNIDSAKAALPALKDVDLDLGKLVKKVSDMSPDQKSKLTGIVSKAMPQLEGAISKISSMAGVGDIIGPTLVSLQNKLKSLM